MLLAVLAAARAGTALVVSVPLSSPDVILALASHEWERLPAAAALAARHPAAIVLLTRPRVITIYTCNDCDHRIDRLVAAGVSGSRIRVIQLAQDGTFGEAMATKEFLAAHHLRRLTVVTTPYHTRRSLATFRKVLAGGYTVGIVPAEASPAVPARWWMTAYDRGYVRYEWAALGYYLVWHGVTPLG